MPGTNKEQKMSIAAPMYIYATEMVTSYYQALKVQEKSILTVTGSGDQVIDALFLGAQKVFGFDLNERAGYLAELKMAALKSLTLEEFLDFFGKDMQSATLKYELYIKLKALLPVNISSFFDQLYAEFNNNGTNLAKSEYFRQRGDIGTSPITSINGYLENAESYRKISAILNQNNPLMFQAGVDDVTERLPDRNTKFDLINLSNVPNYLIGNLPGADPVGQFIEIMKKLTRLLNPGGQIFCYSYSAAIYPNRVASRMPLGSFPETIARIALEGNLRTEKIEFLGFTTNTSDFITVYTPL